MHPDADNGRWRSLLSRASRKGARPFGRAGEIARILVRLALGAVFIYASLHKIHAPHLFAAAIDQYQLLPKILVNPAAVWLPWLELFAGLGLVCGRMRDGALLTINLLLIVFAAALAFNLWRGLNIDCGCFHSDPGGAGTIAMWRTLVRDGLLLAGGLWLWFDSRGANRNMAGPVRPPRQSPGTLSGTDRHKNQPVRAGGFSRSDR